MIAIISSKQDPAGCNIRQKIKEMWGGSNQEGNYFLVEVNVRSPYVQELPKADAYIFASRHVSESGRPALCVHAPGNWSQAMVGGNPRELAFTNAALMKNLLIELEKRKVSGYDVTMECTHHGPTHFTTPCIFIEIGSSEKQWADSRAVETVANTILKAPEKKWIPCVGFGGGHYPIELTKVQLKTEYALGHMFPKYEALDFEMIKQAVEKCHAEKMIIDWKGTDGRQHKLITETAEKLGMELLRTNDLV